MKIAILGNYATQFLAKSLTKSLKKKGVQIEIYNAEFNTTDFEIIDSNSKLFKFDPDYIIWHESTLGVRDLFYQTDLDKRETFAKNYIERIDSYLNKLITQLPNCKVFFPNHSLLFNDNLFGNYYSKVDSSWQFQITRVNHYLNELSISKDNLFVINSVPNSFAEPMTDYTQVVNAELHFSIAYLDWLSDSISKLMLCFLGKFKKCIVLDLDNTLWGGIVGDDGLEGIQIGALGIGKAFTRFQKWLRELKDRGIILAVCTKNEEDAAKSPFLNHPEMILRLEDFAVFIANWNSKADNISDIQKILNIGFDSMVFIDDNPAEREIVRIHIPEITVPELPVDPSDYLPFLIGLNLFETTSFSKNDSERTKQYQEEAKRVELSKSITNMDEFLRSLDMKATVGSFKKSDFERIAQLTQRSNQFNLRTVRYTTSDIGRISDSKSHFTVSVNLQDKFGNYGLISIVILELNDNNTAVIDTWIMSCRVLKRTVENLLMNYIVDWLKENGFTSLRGEYLTTSKNKLVSTLLDEIGMELVTDNMYLLNLKNFKNLKTYIKDECIN